MNHVQRCPNVTRAFFDSTISDKDLDPFSLDATILVMGISDKVPSDSFYFGPRFLRPISCSFGRFVRASDVRTLLYVCG